jgi:hypothetical protein
LRQAGGLAQRVHVQGHNPNQVCVASRSLHRESGPPCGLLVHGLYIPFGLPTM